MCDESPAVRIDPLPAPGVYTMRVTSAIDGRIVATAQIRIGPSRSQARVMMNEHITLTSHVTRHTNFTRLQALELIGVEIPFGCENECCSWQVVHRNAQKQIHVVGGCNGHSW